MSVTDEIKARIDIVDLVGEAVKLKMAGRNYKGICPFQSEKTLPFVVFRDSQTWRVSGRGGEGAKSFNSAMNGKGWNFPGPLGFLRRKPGWRSRRSASGGRAIRKRATG